MNSRQHTQFRNTEHNTSNLRDTHLTQASPTLAVQ
jgi:hypothetical protein